MLLFDSLRGLRTMSPEAKSPCALSNAPVAHDCLVFDDSDKQSLLQQIHYTHQRCVSRRWKLLTWAGLILIVMGILSVVVSYLIPSAEWITASGDLDQDVQIYNRMQECSVITYMCKIIGFLIFCIGGILLTMSLLFSSCFTCSYRRQPGDFLVIESCECVDRTGGQPQMTGPVSCTIQGAQVSEMLRQQIDTHAVSATLI
ncbi:hypothetical protein BsWGS_19443 [Bradybaena similaris]